MRSGQIPGASDFSLENTETRNQVWCISLTKQISSWASEPRSQAQRAWETCPESGFRIGARGTGTCSETLIPSPHLLRKESFVFKAKADFRTRGRGLSLKARIMGTPD